MHFVALFYCCCPSCIPWHWQELELAGRHWWLSFLQGILTHLCLYLPSTSKSSYLLGLPVESMEGASFFCFGFTWIILALPVLSEDIWATVQLYYKTLLQFNGELNISCVVNLTNHLMFPSGGEGRLFRETFLDAVIGSENSPSFGFWIFFPPKGCFFPAQFYPHYHRMHWIDWDTSQHVTCIGRHNSSAFYGGARMD